MDVDPHGGSYEASAAGTVRTGGSGLPAEISGTRERSHDRTLLSLNRACYAHVEELREPFEGAIECDETTIGGALRKKRGWGAAGKVIVSGILQRNGQVDDRHAYGSLCGRKS